jgi:hypothetical protein
MLHLVVNQMSMKNKILYRLRRKGRVLHKDQREDRRQGKVIIQVKNKVLLLY